MTKEVKFHLGGGQFIFDLDTGKLTLEVKSNSASITLSREDAKVLSYILSDYTKKYNNRSRNDYS